MTGSPTSSVNGRTSSWTTEMESSTGQNNITMLSSVSDSSAFTQNLGVTSPSFTLMLISNVSSSMMRNDSQKVDLETLNLSMTLALIPTIGYMAVLIVVGLVGNIVVFLVYYKRYKPSATRTYVLAMSVCDLLANIFSLPSEITDIRYTFTFDLPWLCKSVRGINSFLALTSAFVLVAVARDRYKKICCPMKKQMSMKRVRLCVLICALTSLALSIVFGALNGSRAVDTGVGNATGITCSVSDVFRDTLFPLVYNMIMALAFILCVGIMTVSYICIAVELWKHKKKQARVSGVQITKASSAVSGNKTSNLVVEDTSSGPRQALSHSETKSSSSAELIPLKNDPIPTTGKNPKNKTTPRSADPSNQSDKQVLLLSIRNLNYEGPRSPVEDSDEGCFSTCSVEITSTSGDLSKEGHVQNGKEVQDRSQFQSPHAETINELQEKQVKSVQSDTEAKHDNTEVPETDQNKASGIPGAKADDNITPLHHTQTKTPAILHTVEKKNTSNTSSDKAAGHQDIQPADRSSSLLQRLLTPRKHQEHGHSKAGKPGRCQTPKKHGTVKSIPSSTTLMMFVLTAIFVINYLPHLVIISMRAMSDSFGKGLEGPMLNAYNIALRSYFMNTAANSLVYSFCNARFRHECWLLLSRK